MIGPRDGRGRRQSRYFESGLAVVFIGPGGLSEIRVGFAISENLEGMAAVGPPPFYGIGRKQDRDDRGPAPCTEPRPTDRSATDLTLSRLGLEEREEHVVEGDYYHQSAYHAGARLPALDEPPAAIVAATDMMAAGAILALEEAALRVPADIAVTRESCGAALSERSRARARRAKRL